MHIRKILIIGFGLFAALIIAVLVAASFVDVNQYKGFIAEKVSAATGRDVSISGDLELAVSLSPAVVANGITVANAPWGSKPEMVQVKRAEAKVALLPLIFGKIEIKRFVLIEPEILLETNAEGKGNWEFGKPKAKEEKSEKESETGVPELDIGEIRIEKGRLTYRDGKTKQTTQVGIQRLSLKSSSMGSPIALQLVATYNDLPISVVGTLGSIGALMKNESFPIDITVDVEDAKIALDGSIDKPLEAKGLNLAVSMKADNLKDLSKLAGTELPDVGPLQVAAKLSDPKGGVYSVKDLNLRLDKTDLTGEVSVTVAGKRPSITARLTSSLIDVTPFTAEEEKPQAKKAGKDSDRIFSAEPLSLDGLRAVDADVTLQADRIRTPNLVLDKVNVAVKLANGQLQVKPLTATVGGGTLVADLSLDARGKAAQLSTNVDAKQVGLGALLKETRGTDLMEGGKTDVTIKVAGSGDSVRAIMAGLNGNLLVEVGKARINNAKMNKTASAVVTTTRGLINPLSATDPYTNLECAVVRFDIKDGIATSDKGIGVETEKLIIAGSGEVNLKTETLHIGMQPSARKGIGVGSLAKLVVIGGTLAHPKPEADPKEIIMKGAEIGAVVVTGVATGGLALLAKGLFDSGTADTHPCATALGKALAKAASTEGAKPGAPTEKTTATSSEAKEAASSEEKETKEEGIGGMLEGLKKGIFGK
jgi:hypothetical protein